MFGLFNFLREVAIVLKRKRLLLPELKDVGMALCSYLVMKAD